jgi:hypothetical protein
MKYARKRISSSVGSGPTEAFALVIFALPVVVAWPLLFFFGLVDLRREDLAGWSAFSSCSVDFDFLGTGWLFGFVSLSESEAIGK